MSSAESDSPEPDRNPIEFEIGERFTRLIVLNRPRIFGFIFSLVHDRNAAEDILQEVSSVMWRKFDQFEEGTNFSAWALKIARFAVLEWRRKAARLALPLDEETERLLAEASAEITDEYDGMREALRFCVGKLSPKQSELIRARYFDDEPVQKIASRMERTRMAIYKALKKAHELLLSCIEARNQTSAKPK